VVIESYIQKGNSFPIIINDNEKKYFVKLRAGMSGKYALLNEWIGNKIGAQLGINTQTPIWIELDSDLQIGDIHLEVKELVQKSVGLNIGFDYQPQAIDLKEQELDKWNKQELKEIFLLDLMMINIDRTSGNLNLMKVGGKLFSVDYESSLWLQETLEQRHFLEAKSILQCLRNNPLFQVVDDQTIDAFLKKTEQLSLTEILLDIPVSLLNLQDRKLLIQQFEDKKRKGWFLKEMLYKLNTIKRESTAEQKERINKNQAEFLRKFKKNSNAL